MERWVIKAITEPNQGKDNMEFLKRSGRASLLLLFFIFSFAQASTPIEVQRLRLKAQQKKPLPVFNSLTQQEPFKPIKLKPSDHKKAVRIFEKLGTPAPQPVFVIYPGSLRDNINRLANEFGWKQVVWNAKYDHQRTGTTRITANSLRSILERILKKYPLQAVFYQGNHILAIEPRNYA